MSRPRSWTLGLAAGTILSGWVFGQAAAPPVDVGTIPEPDLKLAAQPPPPGPSADDLAKLQAAVDAAPADPQARRRLAMALFQAGRKDAALQQFTKVVELGSTPRSLLDLALAQSALALLPEAEATYRKLLELAPRDPIALHNLGNLALKKGDAPGAIAWYQQALAAKPDYLLAYYHLGDALRQAGREADAYRAYERALAIDPTNPAEMSAAQDSLYRLAALDLARGAPERAAPLLAELLRANPNHPNAHYALGQALTKLGRAEEAKREFDRHVRLQAARGPKGPVAADD
ncbi:MAG TPA: tetratricopeptide repeat protein [Candidatus Polarisedimenticolaceae bacterium]|nr:tetratricopeptide repeat protein [Candidatus Polarisedimenticolaceae bacterium]